jgi:hypothetical protein
MPHVTLVGDSIFDNAFYVGREPDVITQVRRLLPKGWAATLCAVDGSTTTRIAEQIPRIPPETTHLVVSIGGNDALMNQGVLSARTDTAIGVLDRLAAIGEEFAGNYHRAVMQLAALKKKMVLCTIYNANLPPDVATSAKAALAIFNDTIYAEANRQGVAVLELRRVCTETTDYANPIEPSGKGGEKIARAIVDIVSKI